MRTIRLGQIALAGALALATIGGLAQTRPAVPALAQAPQALNPPAYVFDLPDTVSGNLTPQSDWQLPGRSIYVQRQPHITEYIWNMTAAHVKYTQSANAQYSVEVMPTVALAQWKSAQQVKTYARGTGGHPVPLVRIAHAAAPGEWLRSTEGWSIGGTHWRNLYINASVSGNTAQGQAWVQTIVGLMVNHAAQYKANPHAFKAHAEPNTVVGIIESSLMPKPTPQPVPPSSPCDLTARSTIVNQETDLATKLLLIRQISSMVSDGTLSAAEASAGYLGMLQEAPAASLRVLQATPMSGVCGKARSALLSGNIEVVAVLREAVERGGQPYDVAVYDMAHADLRTAYSYVSS